MRKFKLSLLAALIGIAPVSAFAQDKVTLNWALWDWSSVAYYKPLIDAYEQKNPNIKIEHTDLGSADYGQMVMTQLSGGATNLDIIQIKDVPNYIQLVRANTLENLTTALKEPVDTPDTQALSVDGSYFGLPFRTDRWLLYYNKDLFDAAGVEYPTNDMSWDAYYEKAAALTRGFGVNKVYGAHTHTWATLVQVFGTLDGKNSLVSGDFNFLAPWYQQALKMQQDGTVQTYASLKTSATHYSGPFFNEQVAMMPMGSWFVATLIEKVKSGEARSKSWAIASLPHAEGVEPGTTASQITSLGVNKNSRHKQEALDFIEWVAGPEGAKIIASTGTLPSGLDEAVVAQIAGLDGFPKDETSRGALQSPKTYLQLPVVMNAPQLNLILDRTHDMIMTENVSIEDGLKDMHDAAARLKQ